MQEKHWYVIHTYSGYENKVKANLEKRVHTMEKEDKIFRVVVPVEDEYEIKDGKKRVIQKKVFPGYVLVEMIMSDDSWYVVRNTPGVTGFVGSGNRPIPLLQEEVDMILKEGQTEEAKPRVQFSAGEHVKVIDGPFEDFTGTIDAVDPDRAKLKVLVSLFGRETPVELDYGQVEKL
jgi:transcriptional antiterminator NusG